MGRRASHKPIAGAAVAQPKNAVAMHAAPSSPPLPLLLLMRSGDAVACYAWRGLACTPQPWVAVRADAQPSAEPMQPCSCDARHHHQQQNQVGWQGCAVLHKSGSQMH